MDRRTSAGTKGVPGDPMLPVTSKVPKATIPSVRAFDDGYDAWESDDQFFVLNMFSGTHLETLRPFYIEYVPITLSD